MNDITNLFAQTTGQISLAILVFDLVLTAICAMILERFFVKYGQSLSNRKRLGRNFVLISVTTALIISVVKSSLALSLGLVGALSIVRFRSAIKEPEELAYLFLAIALGLGFGANQHAVTLVAFLIILLILRLQLKWQKPDQGENLYLSVKVTKKPGIDVGSVVKALKPYCKKIDIKRMDKNPLELQLAMMVEFTSPDSIDEANKALAKLDREISITVIDQSGILV